VKRHSVLGLGAAGVPVCARSALRSASCLATAEDGLLCAASGGGASQDRSAAEDLLCHPRSRGDLESLEVVVVGLSRDPRGRERSGTGSSFS